MKSRFKLGLAVAALLSAGAGMGFAAADMPGPGYRVMIRDVTTGALTNPLLESDAEAQRRLIPIPNP